MTEAPFTSEDPLVCAHQALRLQSLLQEFAGRYEETWVVLNRLEIVYLCAGRRDDADLVHQRKLKLAQVRPVSPEQGSGFFGRLRWWWQVTQQERYYRRGQLTVDHHLAALDRLAPWEVDALPEPSA